MNEEHFVSADDFLGALTPLNPRWRSTLFPEWVFRGQANADWKLLCSSWRDDGNMMTRVGELLLAALDGTKVGTLLDRWQAKPPIPEFNKGDAVRTLVRAAAEHEVVCRFVYLCDQVGLPTTGGRPMSGRAFLEQAMEAPNDSVRLVKYVPTEIFQLAQHHQIPTKLLDWTFNPLMAAFFATSDRDHRGQRVAVFALRARALVHPVEARFMRYGRVLNQNMHAQAGAFTRVDPWITHRSYHPALDDVLSWRPELHDPLQKFTLPAESADEVCQRLSESGVTRAHAFPSYPEAAAAVKREIERSDWRPLAH